MHSTRSTHMENGREKLWTKSLGETSQYTNTPEEQILNPSRISEDVNNLP